MARISWPARVAGTVLAPLDGTDGPLLQRLFDDLSDFETLFWERGQADAVSTFIALPEGRDYDDKLLVGVWRDPELIGAIDCIADHPEPGMWSIGMFVLREADRGAGLGTALLDWLVETAAGCGAERLLALQRRANRAGVAFLERRGFRPQPAPEIGPDHVLLSRPVTFGAGTAPADPVRAGDSARSAESARLRRFDPAQ